MHRVAIIFSVLLCLGGCADLQYYAQAARGQSEIMNRAKPIAEIIDDPTTPPTLKTQLTKALEIREFASRELALPNNQSYRRYADLERPFAIWNVFAAPALSLAPKEWCILFFGCSAYHSYFSHAAAEREAVALRAEGYDVYVAGITAYSTSGWFSDPLFNTMLANSEPDLAAVLFHELAHQRLRAPDDTAFTESFAMAVEREGVRRWLAAHDGQTEFAGYLERHRRREEVTALLMRYRARLQTLYSTTLPDDDKRAQKQALLDEMRGAYQKLKANWNDYVGFDRWMQQLNNAKFISVSLYSDYVPAFEALLAQQQGNLPAFYRAAETLAREPKAVRAQKLKALTDK